MNKYNDNFTDGFLPLEIIEREKERPLSVTEASRTVKRYVHDEIGTLSVLGEISSARPNSSGHVYFDLKDSNATIGAVVWRSYTSTLKHVRDGALVVATGTFDIYEKTGKLTFIVTSIKEAGEGGVKKKLEERKRYYESLGWFDPSIKKRLPDTISSIAIVTSATGAVIHDMLDVTGRRAPSIKITLYPSPVQGENAGEIIAARIRQANAQGGYDVIIVARGGGSQEDLMPYSTDPVVQAIHESQTPVISAVGHESDWSLSDYVADVRAGTPSIAAELVTATMLKRREAFRTIIESINSAMNYKTNIATMRLKSSGDIETLLRRKAENMYNSVAMAGQGLDSFMAIKRDAARGKLSTLKVEIKANAEAIFGNTKMKFSSVSKELEALSPYAVLSRGYSMVTDHNGKVVKNALDVKGGDHIRIKTGAGDFGAVVEI